MCPWLMQHVSTNSRSECVYSTHSSAYAWIVCAQYRSSLHLSVVRRRWYVRWEFTFVQISEQTKQIYWRQTFDSKVLFAHAPSPLFSPLFFPLSPFLSPSILLPLFSFSPYLSATIPLQLCSLPQAQKSLVVARTVGDWVIRACTNCDTDVYILHTVKEGRVFATKSLLVRSGCGLGCGAYGLCVRGSILGTQDLCALASHDN